MKKNIVKVLSIAFLALAFISCISTKTYTVNENAVPKEDLITISGKGGIYFEGIDGEVFEKTRSIKVTEGKHTIIVGVEKGSKYFLGEITGKPRPKNIYAVKGQNMIVDAEIIEKGPSSTTTIGNYKTITTLLNISLVYRIDTQERLGTTLKTLKSIEKIEIDETHKEIEILKELPTDRKFEFVGNLKSEISVTLFNYSKLDHETVYKFFLTEAEKNGIDALVDVCPYSNSSNYGKGYTGLGIKYTE